MWIEDNGKGKRAVWQTGKKTGSGRAQVDKSPTFPTEAAAIDWFKEHGPKNGVKVLSELLEMWRVQEKSDYRSEASALLAKLFVARSWFRVADVTPAAIAAWHTDVDGVGVTRPMGYLLSVLRWGLLTHDAPVNQKTLTLSPPATAKKAKAPLLTDDQVTAIRDCSFHYGVRAASIVDYLLSFGARPITACRLGEVAVDLARCELTIDDAKHSGGWRHPVTETQASAWLEVARDVVYDPKKYDGQRVLFPHYKENRPWRVTDGHAHELTDWYKNTIAKRLKLPVQVRTIYHLKRYAITRMLRAGIDAYQVSLFTGHLDVKQVLTYNSGNEETAREALAKLTALGGWKPTLNTLAKSHNP